MQLSAAAEHHIVLHRVLTNAEILITGWHRAPDTYFVQAVALGDKILFEYVVTDDEELLVDSIRQILRQALEEIVDQAVLERKYLAGLDIHVCH